MKKIVVCPTPSLIHLYKNIENKIVIVADIFRATSCIVTALAHGVSYIRPVTTLKACRQFKKKGYIIAGEREGKIVPGFDLGNSPFSYQATSLQGKRIAITTTNGTQAIECVKHAHKILLGSFLNLSAITAYCLNQSHDILILCAGSKGRVSTEDTIFASTFLNHCKKKVTLEDGFSISLQICNLSTTFLTKYLRKFDQINDYSSQDLLSLNKDRNFCLQQDIYSVIPVLQNQQIITTV